MSKVLLALTSAMLLGLSGCADMHSMKTADSAPAISAEAQSALNKAKADVKMAKSKDALWSTAADSLKDAEEAAKKGDSAKVLKESKEASDHVRLGIEQLKYPTLKVGD